MQKTQEESIFSRAARGGIRERSTRQIPLQYKANSQTLNIQSRACQGKATIANIVLATMHLGPCPSLSFWKSRRTASGLMQPANTNALLPRTQHEFRAAFPILSSPKFIPKTHFTADHNIEKLSLNKECPLVLLLLNYSPIIWKRATKGKPDFSPEVPVFQQNIPHQQKANN